MSSVVLSFPHLHEKHAATSTSDPKYAGDFIIDPSTKTGKANIKQIEAAIEDVEKAAFGKTGLKYKEGRKAFIDGNTVLNKDDEVPAELADKWVIKAKNNRRPTLVDRRGETSTKEDDLFYGGAIVNPILRFYAIDSDDKDKGGRGLFCSLEGVQFVEEGERFGAAPLSEDRFKNLEGDGDGEDEKPKKSKKDKKGDKKSKDGKKSKKDRKGVLD